MRSLVVATAALVLAVGVVGTTRGVERERYVAANQALFETLPVFPGARLRSVHSTPRRENESPWSRVTGYRTLYLVDLPVDAEPDEVAALYERALEPEWTLVDKPTDPPSAAGPILGFRRENAYVGVNLESWRGRLLEIYVDHAAG